jgi:hypothetical protein
MSCNRIVLRYPGRPCNGETTHLFVKIPVSPGPPFFLRLFIESDISTYWAPGYRDHDWRNPR